MLVLLVALNPQVAALPIGLNEAGILKFPESQLSLIDLRRLCLEDPLLRLQVRQLLELVLNVIDPLRLIGLILLDLKLRATAVCTGLEAKSAVAFLHYIDERRCCSCG